VLQYDNEGTNCYKVKATYILYLFPWWGICFQLQAQRKQPTVATGSILVVGGTLLPRSHISLLHPKLQLLWPCLKQHGISTNVKQHTHALLNICINLLCRRPAQVHVLVFKCLSLSQFHSQIPKIYTFQTWYSLSLCHSFLCLGSPCHPNSNAKLQHNAYSTLHELI